jgi:hypothetical protein
VSSKAHVVAQAAWSEPFSRAVQIWTGFKDHVTCQLLQECSGPVFWCVVTWGGAILLAGHTRCSQANPTAGGFKVLFGVGFEVARQVLAILQLEHMSARQAAVPCIMLGPCPARASCHRPVVHAASYSTPIFLKFRRLCLWFAEHSLLTQPSDGRDCLISLGMHSPQAAK